MRDRYTSSVTWQMTENIGEYLLVEERFVLYDGPWDELKKGREQMDANMKADAATAAKNRANSSDAYNKAQGLYGEDIGSSTPGSLTPASSAQLGADLDNIRRTYAGVRAQSAATIGRRGFGGAPSGFGAVANNAANEGESNAGTGAFRNAQVNTQNERNFAATGEGNLSGQQGSLGNQASGESTNAAVDLNHAGSTFGDIVSGAAELAPIVAAPFTGGASLFPGLAANAAANPFSKLGKTAGSGVGGYGGGTQIGGPDPNQRI